MSSPVWGAYLIANAQVLYLLYPRSATFKVFPSAKEYFRLESTQTFLNQLAVKTISYVTLVYLGYRNTNIVLMPYIPDETESATRERMQFYIVDNEIAIVDINLDKIPKYTGKYGSLPRDFKMISECQTYKLPIIITEYKEILKDIVHEFEGITMMGKNDEYIINVSASFEDIYNPTCKFTYYQIYAHKLSLEQGVSNIPKLIGHNMLLIVDTFNKQVELFDSNGITSNTRHVYFWVNKFIEWLQTKEPNVQYRRILSSDDLFCPQMISFLGQEEDYRCIVWANYYAYLRLNNPSVDRRNIIRYLHMLTPEDIEEHTGKFATVIYDNQDTYLENIPSSVVTFKGYPRDISFNVSVKARVKIQEAEKYIQVTEMNYEPSNSKRGNVFIIKTDDFTAGRYTNYISTLRLIGGYGLPIESIPNGEKQMAILDLNSQLLRIKIIKEQQSPIEITYPLRVREKFNRNRYYVLINDA